MKASDYLTPEELFIIKRAWAIFGVGPEQTKILNEPWKAFIR